jgi:2-phosphosulfolactate phosphatase
LKDNAERIRIGLGVKGVVQAARSNDLVVVVDVLRASSTIITAISNGALSILPTLSIKEARSMAEAVHDSILGGERRGLRIPGFQLGNSPLEYTSEIVHNKNIVFTSTNCTKVLEECKQLPSSNEVCIGAFLNVTAIVREAKRFLDRGKGFVSIVQAGSSGKESLDDLLCAGIIKTMIQTEGEQWPAPRMRRIMSFISHVVLSNTKHGRYLRSIGFQDDLKYCSQVSVVNLVPRLEKGWGIMPRIVGSSSRFDKQ